MRSRQRGTTTVEFAIIAALFLVVLFGVIEVGRALFVWNTLTEATRRGARVAVVCPVNDPVIARVTVFGDPLSSTTSPILNGLTTGNVQITYLNQNGSAVANPGGAGFIDIRYVQVAITGYQHTLLIPFFTQLITAPSFGTTLPRESMGWGGCNFPA
jgi:hypothetical protein